MFKTIRSDADADALLAKLARATDPVNTVTARMANHVPRAFLPFLAGLLGGADRVVLQGARLTGDTVALAGPWANTWMLSRRIDLAFHGCVLDDAFLHALLDDWTHGRVFGTLEFRECDYAGDASRPARDLSAWVHVDTLQVRSCESTFTLRVGMLARFMDVRVLDMNGVGADFVAWLPYVPTRSLRTLMLSGAVLDTDGAETLAGALRRADALMVIELARELEDANPLPAVVADAIGARPRERIRVYGIPVSTDNLVRMVQQQTSLLELVIYDLENPADLAGIALTVIRQNPRFRRLGFFRDATTKADIRLTIPGPLLAALLRHDHIIELGKTEFIPELDAHLRANAEVQLFTNIALDNPAGDLRITPVFCTGALRDAACAQLGGATTADAIERTVARAVVAANAHVYSRLQAVYQILPYRALLGEEFREAIRSYNDPVLEPALVPYAVAHLPNALPPGVHVHALRGSRAGALENLAVAPPDILGHELLVTDGAPAPGSLYRLAKMRPDVTRVDFADLPRAVRASAATFVAAPAMLRDQLCLLAVVRAPKHVLSAAEVAYICAEISPDARLPPNPYTYALPGGGVIPRMPAVLETLRKTFALPALLVRIVNRVGRVHTDWFHNGVLPAAAIVDVFNYVLELDDDQAKALAKEAVRILTTFDVIFPIDRNRAVFPKFRGVPAIMYRTLAYLLGRDTYHVLSLDDAGAIAFVVSGERLRGERMTARPVDGAVAITAENPALAADAARATHALNQIVDL